ncbi:MAG: autotransporter-associated beta strand repeat-containing protein [Kiritimatiellae bacterium]|nr:autotransporter-associated beta strand repeat-containing protein [Kiritimatiellia bacterium]
MSDAYTNHWTCRIAAVVGVFGIFSLSAETYTTAGSGPWSSESTWVGGAVPTVTGTETNSLKDGHVVTYDGTDACWHTMYVGSSSGLVPTGYRQVGGTLTSERLTEIGNATSRAGESFMELENVDANFNAYRLVLGRNKGNARLKMTGGSLTFGAGNALLMGIKTEKSMPPNRMELEDVTWNNLGQNLFVGYSNAGTNIVHLRNSALNSSSGALIVGYLANDYGLTGQDFVIAENSSLSLTGRNVELVDNAMHEAHLTLSNSTLKCAQLLMGCAAGATSHLELIDSPPIQSTSTSWVGYRPDTVSHVLFKDLRSPKGTAAEAMAALSLRSVAGERRRFYFTVDSCDWSGTATLRVSSQYNERTMAFRNMTLPGVSIQVGYYAASPAVLQVSNCTWNVANCSLNVANVYNSEGRAEIWDSDLSCVYLNLVDDNTNTEDQPQRGELLVSGGSFTVAEQLQIRRGVGRLVLERGAEMTCSDAYLPNMTGAAAEVVVGEDSRLRLTKRLIIGNQAGVSCALTIKPGAQLVVDKGGSATFGAASTNFLWQMEGGELDLGGRAAAFATAAVSEGTAYLRGGVVKAMGFGTPAAAGTQKIVFDGATVKLTGDCVIIADKSDARVANGGAIFEVDEGVRAYVNGSLQHDATAEVVDGGLVKKGAGMLELNRAGSTFTGPVRIEAGTLKLTVTGCLPANARIVLNAAAGACLQRGTSAAYPEGLSLEVTGEMADASRHVLVEGWSGELPTITGVPKGWDVELRDGKIMMYPVRGFALILK